MPTRDYEEEKETDPVGVKLEDEGEGKSDLLLERREVAFAREAARSKETIQLLRKE